MRSIPILSHCRWAASLATISICMIMVSGCAGEGTKPHGTQAGISSTSTRTATPEQSTPPGATVAPQTLEAQQSVPDDYTLTVLAVGSGEHSGAKQGSGVETAAKAITDDAASRGIDVSVVRGTPDEDQDELVASAIATGSDVVVVLGAASLDAVDRSSATNLSQDFVIIGAQLPEPTSNVTSVVWPGADSRSTLTSGKDGGATPAPSADLGRRAAEALSAGLASVVSGNAGFVVKLPEA